MLIECRPIVWLLVIAIGLLGILTVIGALIVYLPGAAVVILVVLACALLLVVIGTVVVSVVLSIEIPPVRPLAETSILGKHAVGLGKLTVALLAFFGNTALTWIIALNVTLQKPSPLLPDIGNQLWTLFGTLIGPIAYFFWMWIAFDLTRAGRARRAEAVDSLADRFLGGIEGHKVGTLVRRIAHQIASGPWWQTMFSFYMAPLLLIASITSLPIALTR